jgi:hypothetical protein
MAGLFLAQQVTKTTNIHIVAGELEASPQRIKLLHDLKAPLSLTR